MIDYLIRAELQKNLERLHAFVARGGKLRVAVVHRENDRVFKLTTLDNEGRIEVEYKEVGTGE